ncbi:MAG: LamG domain-containing protein [Planctomycetota bacterium]
MAHPSTSFTALLTTAAAAIGSLLPAQGSALSFDGVDDYVEFGFGDSYTTAELSFTAEAWLKVPAGGPQVGLVVATAYEPYCSDAGYSLFVSETTLPFDAGGHIARRNCGNDTALSGFVSEYGEWHHLAMTYAVTGSLGSTAVGDLDVYIDGQRVGAVVRVRMDAEARPRLKFGCGSGAGSAPLPGSYFRGELDEVRIWNFARSQADIQCTMLTGLTGSEPGLVGYWPLDDGIGQSVTNSGNPSAWRTQPFGWAGRLGATSGVDASDPTWVPSTAPFRGVFLPVAAQEVVRVGNPANPAALMPGQSSGPVIGQRWDPLVDHGTGFATKSAVDFLVLALGPANLTVPGIGGTILCDVTQPGWTLVRSFPGVPFALDIPYECALAGATMCAQGGSLDSCLGLVLTNALDVTIGTF